MNTIYWHMNATQGGANCAHEHGLRCLQNVVFFASASPSKNVRFSGSLPLKNNSSYETRC